MTGNLQVKNGKYYMIFNIYENGKRKQKWEATGLSEKGNKRKAEKMLRDRINEIEIEQVRRPADEIIFTDCVVHWLNVVKDKVDPITYQGYDLITKRHIISWPGWTGLSLSKIDRKLIQRFLDEKKENGRLDGKGGLSSKSVREFKNLLNLAFTQAIREDLLTNNPCEALQLPPKDSPEAHFYTLGQLNTLLSVSKDEPLYPIIKTAIVYGLRKSEILGLKWDSIDFDLNTLSIKYTVVKVTKAVEKARTKTKSSHRTFPLFPDMKDLFESIKKEQEANRKLFGAEYIQNDYVFCWPNGKPIGPDYVSHKFPKILKKYGLPHIRFHELRHSCASFLINQGFQMKDIQEWMGHSDIGTTMNIYGHLEMKRKLEIAEKMSNSITG